MTDGTDAACVARCRPLVAYLAREAAFGAGRPVDLDRLVRVGEEALGAALAALPADASPTLVSARVAAGIRAALLTARPAAPSRPAADPDAGTAVRRGLATLPPHLAELLEAAYVDQAPAAEVARRAAVPEADLPARRSQALRLLGTALDGAAAPTQASSSVADRHLVDDSPAARRARAAHPAGGSCCPALLLGVS